MNKPCIKIFVTFSYTIPGPDMRVFHPVLNIKLFLLFSLVTLSACDLLLYVSFLKQRQQSVIVYRIYATKLLNIEC